MKTVDSSKLHIQTEENRFNLAKKCNYVAVDIHDAPCLWHKTFCLHPRNNHNTETEGRYAFCNFVWKGHCEFGEVH